MARQSEAAAATRQAFVDAFCALYKTKPVEKITVQELTRKAGYNRCTFYEYFADVYDLLAQIEDELIARVRERILAAIDRGDIAERFVQSFLEMQKEVGAYAELLLGSEHGEKFVGRLKTAMLPVLMERFHISQRDRKSLYALEFYVSGVISVASRWLKCGRDATAEELGGYIRSVLTEGILSMLKSNPFDEAGGRSLMA